MDDGLGGCEMTDTSLKVGSAVENEVLALLDATLAEAEDPTDDDKKTCRPLSPGRNSMSSSGLSSLGGASQDSLDDIPTVSITEAQDPSMDAAYVSDDLLDALPDTMVSETSETRSRSQSPVPSKESMCEENGGEATGERCMTNGNAKSPGSILLGGGTIVMSVADDQIQTYEKGLGGHDSSSSDCKQFLPSPDGDRSESRSSGGSVRSLTSIFEVPTSPGSGFSPPPVSPFGTLTRSNPSDFKWDELGRMQSTSGLHRVSSKKKLARSGSETEFLLKNVEMKTVALNKPKKGGYGFCLKGDGPVWISEVDKGSVAEAAGMREGGVLIEVNGRNVEEANHETVLRYIINGPQPLAVTFQVVRDRRSTSTIGAAIMSGYLTKQGGTGITPKNWRKRWFVLKEDGCLYYYKNEKDIRPLGAIVLQGYTVSKALDVDKKAAFKLIKGGARTYYMYTDTEAEMNSWARFLTEAAESFNEGGLQNSMGPCAHNVSIPALSIRDAENHGWLYKQGGSHKNWKHRYCVLKDKCLYYYKEMTDQTALGVMKLHGYRMVKQPQSGKKLLFSALPSTVKERAFHFYTMSELEFNRWFHKMEESIAQPDC